ncbi:MAG: 5'/3'-nucleotidase SurE [Anaerovibrio sp.]|nr:5'/3'-nucleotidase SurE [Anaerovibrio sp.]
MQILISNDDGIQSPGIEALVKALYKEHTLVVAAPAEQQSAKAHAITVRNRLYVEEYLPLQEKYGITALAVTGTPADAVKLYLEGIIGDAAAQRPDLVLSGINDGSNVGTDLLYSGTVGAAAEGFVHNIDSLAVSLDYDSEATFDFVAEKVRERLPQLFPAHAPEGKKLININFPQKLAADCKWIWCRQGIRDYCNAYQPQYDEKGCLFYTVGGCPLDGGNEADTDVMTVAAGHVAVTPLQLDKTDFAALELGREL